MEILQFIRDYWFLFTLVISIVTAIFAMVVFQVSPWEKYRETRERKAAVKFHLQLGQTLLDAGYYQDAAGEFEHSLKLVPSNPDSLEGKRKTDLFLRMRDLDWKPGRVMTYWDHFTQHSDHNMLLYMGMLQDRIGEPDEALKYFFKAMQAYPGETHFTETYYRDALFQIGWIYYHKGDYDQMGDYFRKMKETAIYDYRGYHGLGYALYMKAIAESNADGNAVIKLLNEAAQLLYTASRYVPSILVVHADIGEIVRVIDPEFSISVHERAMECLTNDEYYSLWDNYSGVSAILISSNNQQVFLSKKEDKIAWVNYLLALDYYIKALLENKDAPDLGRHDQYMKDARSIQSGGDPEKIYQDQKTIGDRLLKYVITT